MKNLVIKGAALAVFGGLFLTPGQIAAVAQQIVESDAADSTPDRARKKYAATEKPEIADQADRVVAPGGAADDFFGYAVAVSGDTAIVGAFGADVGGRTDQGAAYIFTRDGANWTLQAQLNAGDGAANDAFGYAVAISGDTAIVGAPLADQNSNQDQGAVYVFTRSGAVWTQQTKLAAGDGAAGDQFGFSAALSGGTAIVGAITDTVGGNAEQGSAYVFAGGGASWTQQAQLVATDGAAGDSFGYSVALSGDAAIVGAIFDDVGANADQGSASIFARNNGVWTPQAQLRAAGGAADDFFGGAVAINGGTAVVGAYGDDINQNADQGSACVFTGGGANWTQQAQLAASDGAASDQFGFSVGISGGSAVQIVVGAPLADVGGTVDQGSAYIYERAGANWTERRRLIETGGAAGDQYGFAVAVSGIQIVVGAPNSDAAARASGDVAKLSTPAASNQGAVAFFVNTPLVPTAAAVTVAGRVVTPNNAGLTNALVTLTDARGNSRTAKTGRSGAFRFAEVAAGETFTLTVNSKRYVFAAQIITPIENLTELIFAPQ